MAVGPQDPPRSLRGGPAGAAELGEQLRTAVAETARWMREFGDFAPHASLDVPVDVLERATGELRARLRENYPFFHPRYAGQMLKPPHPAAVIGYVTAMLVNPNNHALDGGPATARMEKEVVARLAAMFGFGEARVASTHPLSCRTRQRALAVSWRVMMCERGQAPRSPPRDHLRSPGEWRVC
jgi:glutamate/tyrosine decarboxylase-like PLP-dependent enzyme